MKGLYKYLRNYRIECFLAPFFKLLEAAFELTVPLVIASLIDVGIANNDRGYVVKMVLILAMKIWQLPAFCSGTAPSR